MLYSVAKIICKVCIQFYYGKIEVKGLEHLPTDMPILLACNHPTGFFEPVIIACIMDRPLHFITRGDLFSKKLLGPLLRATNQIPIFRFKDGYAGLRQNNKSIAAAKAALTGGGALLMFVEGKTEDVKMLKPLQKGMARISTALHSKGLEHAIVPLGINYIDTVTLGSRVMLNFGKPIDPAPIITSATDERKAYPKLNKVVASKMKEMLLHVGDRSRHSVHEAMIDAAQTQIPQYFLPVIDRSPSTFTLLKPVSVYTDTCTEQQLSELSQLQLELTLNAPSRYLQRRQEGRALSYLALLFLLPMAVVGVIINALPLLGALSLEKTLVRSREFVAVIRFAAAIGIALLYYPVLIFILWTYIGWYSLLLLLGLPFLFAAKAWLHHYRNVSKKYQLAGSSVDRLVAIFTHLK